MTRQDLEQRVTRAAEAALAEQRFVSAIDVLLGLGWLAPSHLDRWRQGRVESLERVVQANLSKVAAAMAAFRRWARDRGLNPSATDYVARTRDRRQLRFSVSGDAAIERAYRTHWVSPDLSQRAVERQSRPPDLVVISPVKEWTCTSCGDTGDLLLMEDSGPLCLDCSDLGHLVFLPSGDAALTRRAKKASRLSAVVVRWSRARKRYERQGILAEAEAIERAEQECLSDAEVRARRRERDEALRVGDDVQLQAELAAAIRAAGWRTEHLHSSPWPYRCYGMRRGSSLRKAPIVSRSRLRVVATTSGGVRPSHWLSEKSSKRSLRNISSICAGSSPTFSK